MTDRMNRTEYVHVMKGMDMSSRHQVASDGCMAEASWVAILEKTGTEAISRHVNMFKFFSLSKQVQGERLLPSLKCQTATPLRAATISGTV